MQKKKKKSKKGVLKAGRYKRREQSERVRFPALLSSCGAVFGFGLGLQISQYTPFSILSCSPRRIGIHSSNLCNFPFLLL